LIEHFNKEKNMKKIDPEEVVKKYIAAKDGHDWDALVTLLDPDYVSSDPSIPEPVKGIEPIRQYLDMLTSVEMKTRILSMMSKGDTVGAELEVTCLIKIKHPGEKGEFAGHTIIPSGRPFKVTFAKFYRVNSKGLLAEEREYSDTITKMRALGAQEDADSDEQAVTSTATGDLTPKIILEQKVAQNLKAHPELTQKLQGVCQFDITGPNGGQWYIDLDQAKDVVAGGNIPDATCTISMKDDNLVAFFTGKLSAEMAFVTGKLKIKGDMTMASALREVLKGESTNGQN
jgi:putative sterol carrier protein/ketosteroid isomerase-like protein